MNGEHMGIPASADLPAPVFSMRPPTERQLAVLRFIHDTVEKFGWPPTMREIGGHIGIRSTNGVNDHLRALERRGLIRREETKARGLTVSRAGRRCLGLDHFSPELSRELQLEIERARKRARVKVMLEAALDTLLLDDQLTLLVELLAEAKAVDGT